MEVVGACIAVGSVVEHSSVAVDSMVAVHNSAVEEVCIAAGSVVDNTVVELLVDQNIVGTAVVQLEVVHHWLWLPFVQYSFQTE